MVSVTWTERSFRSLKVPRAIRPALGGAVVGALALIYPQVLSSGHGALYAYLNVPFSAQRPDAGAAVQGGGLRGSVGSGFRGGLFFASLFMGALLGNAYGVAVGIPGTRLVPGHACLCRRRDGGDGGQRRRLALDHGVPGAGDHGRRRLAPAITAAVLVAAITARRLFGFSFATWRFHLRGEAIRSAHDVGWIRNLTVGRLMRRDLRTVRADTALGAFRRQFPLGSTNLIVAVDGADRYAGLILMAEAHDPALDEKASALKLASLLRHAKVALLPSMNLKEAATIFERAEADALVVVDSMESLKVLGVLTEAHALRRYSEQLDQRRRELAGEG